MSPKVARIFALFQQDRLAARTTAITPAPRTGAEAADLTTFPAFWAPKYGARPYDRRSVCFALSGVSGPPAQTCKYFLDGVQKAYPPNGVESSSMSQPRRPTWQTSHRRQWLYCVDLPRVHLNDYGSNFGECRELITSGLFGLRRIVIARQSRSETGNPLDNLTLLRACAA
jgi:hypothetical protein